MSRETLPTIDVVIAALNEEQSIGQCLQSLQNQNYPQHLLTPYVVIDGRTTDGTAEVARTNGGIVSCAKGTGIPHVRNFGLHLGSGELVAFLDAHCFPSTGWAQAMAEVFADEMVGGCQGNIDDICDDSRLRQFLRCSPTSNPERLAKHTVEGRSAPFPWVIGGNSVFRRTALEEIGPIDQCLCEDIERSWELVLSGYQLRYAAKATATHYNHSSVVSYVRRSFSQGKVAAQLGYAYGFPWRRSKTNRLYKLNLETIAIDVLYEAGYFVEESLQRFGVIKLAKRNHKSVQSRFRPIFSWTRQQSLQISPGCVYWMVGSDITYVVHFVQHTRVVLEGVANLIFRQLIAERDRSETCKSIVEHYNAASVETDVDEFIDQLRQEGLLTVSAADTAGGCAIEDGITAGCASV